MLKRLLLLGFIILLLASCSNTSKQNNDEKIYTTIYPIHFIVNELIGEEIEVISVYPPGVDAHTFEPTTKEMLNIATGKAFFYLGANMEGFTSKAKEALKKHDVQFIEIGEHKEIFSENGSVHDDHGHSHDFDPHFWFDPLRMIDVATIVKDHLLDLFPEKENVLETNYAELEKEFKQLDERFIENLSETRKKHIIVSHGAYSYWEERYGIIQIPISGLTATEEPSQKELAEIVELARELELNYVLFEQNASNKTADIIRDHLKAEKLTIHNLEVLVNSDLEKEENYFTLMEYNLNQLVKALQ